MFYLYICMIGNFIYLFIHLFKSAWERHMHINIYICNKHKNLAMFVSTHDIYVIIFDICIFSCNNPERIYSFSPPLPPILQPVSRYRLYIWSLAFLLCLEPVPASFLTYTWAINRFSSTRWKFPAISQELKFQKRNRHTDPLISMI